MCITERHARTISPVAVVLLTLCALSTQAQAESGPGSVIPEGDIARLQGTLEQAGTQSSAISKRRAYKAALRDGQELLDAHPSASNRFRVLGAMLDGQKKLLVLENADENRAALYQTCSALALAPEAYAALRLEADMLLMDRDLAARNATPEERATALTDLTVRYRGTSAEAKSLVIGLFIAKQLGNVELEQKMLDAMDDRFQGDHELIEFRRTHLKPLYLDAVFTGTYTRSDGVPLSFPMDLFGHTCLLYFWSQQTPDLEERLKDVKALQDQFPGQFEVFSFNVDELPDAGEKRLRALGLDWMAMQLPGGRSSSAYRAYAAKDPNAVLVNAFGHALLVTTPQEDGLPLIPQRGAQTRGGGIAGLGIPQLDECLDDPRLVSQLQSLFVGDFLISDPFEPIDPLCPPEMKMVAMSQGGDVAKLARDPASVPVQTLETIQKCFVAPPLRYRMTRAEALSNYERAEKLCRDAVAKFGSAPDLWLVRNRRIVALMGLWRLECDPRHLERAVEEAHAALAAEWPTGAGVVPQFCLAVEGLRRGKVKSESVVTSFLEAAGGDRAPASAYAAGAILALEANARGPHAACSTRLRDAAGDGNPLVWPVTSFLRDQVINYRLFFATHSRYGFNREQRHSILRNVAGLERPAEYRKLTAEFNTLDGGKLRIPQDTAGRPTLLVFMEMPPDAASAETQRACMGEHAGVQVIGAFLTEDAGRVRDLVKENGWTCKTVLVPGGLQNPLVLQLGILSADRWPNFVLLRADGTISWSVSGLPFNMQGSSQVSAILNAVEANVTVCQMEAATAILEKGDFKDAVVRFSESLPPNKSDWWGSFKYYSRARAYMGLQQWEPALADIEAALDAHRIFSSGRATHCKRVSEMELVKARILDKLGRTKDAEEERARAATPTYEHTLSPYGLYRDDTLLRRLSPHG